MSAQPDTGPTADRRPEVWTSPFAFLYAAAAAAIGLGSLWRFPYVAGVNGGGAFVLIYLAFVALLCVPLMIAEISLGRRGHANAITTIDAVVKAEGASPAWKAIGWLSILIPFFGLSYYSVVAGWALDYARLAVFPGFDGFDAVRSNAAFATLAGSPWRGALAQGLFIAAAVAVVARGVRRGIEWISRIKMVALLVILLVLVGYNVATLDMTRTLRFLFVPNFAALGPGAVLAALGQALFSTAIGAGVMITYAAYLPKGASLARSAIAINGAVVCVAMLAGLAIFPVVFAKGLAPAGGPNLIFVTLPVAFGSMPFGRILSILFFVMIVLGAFTTSIGMLEPVIAWLMARTRLGRGSAAATVGLSAFAVGLPSLLSFNVLKDFHPLAAFAPFAKKTPFDLLDFGIANTLLPLNALLIALFVGWAVNRAGAEREAGLTGTAASVWRLILRFIAPAAIIGLMISLIAFPG